MDPQYVGFCPNMTAKRAWESMLAQRIAITSMLAYHFRDSVHDSLFLIVSLLVPFTCIKARRIDYVSKFLSIHVETAPRTKVLINR